MFDTAYNTGMRCPSCNKFVPFDTDSEPEVDIDIDADGSVSGTVRIVNTCAECGEELKEASLDVSEDLTDECDGHLEDGFVIERIDTGERMPDTGVFPSAEDAWQDAEIRFGHEQASLRSWLRVTERTHELSVEPEDVERTEQAKGKKTLYGATMRIEVSCSCKDDWTVSRTWSDEVFGSDMDELV
jgi:hypothetical protein